MTWLEQQVCKIHNERRKYDKERKKWICETCDWRGFIKKYGKNNAVVFPHKPIDFISNREIENEKRNLSIEIP